MLETFAVVVLSTCFTYMPHSDGFTFFLRFPLLGAMYGMMTCAMVKVMSGRIEESSYPATLMIGHVIVSTLVFPALIYVA